MSLALESSARGRWQAPEVAGRYARDRFASGRAAGRDPRIVARLLAGLRLERGAVLDAPCGAGRLFGAIGASGARAVGLDASRAMLAEARNAGAVLLVHGDVARLPFRDGAFDAVVCCRLLHHLRERDELLAAARELVRVARVAVIASFWDAASLPAWRRRVGLRRDEARRAIARGELARVFADAGAEVQGFRATFRFVSQQTFVVARVRGSRA